MTQRMLVITSPFFINEERLAAAGHVQRLFDEERPLALEIGCGIGDFIIQLAAQRPDRNYLALDIYNKGCLKTCRRLETAGLNNVRVMRLEARYFLDRYLPPETLSEVFINCPDPWPKKRHRHRRLVSADFTAALLCFLRPGGELFFSSDFEDYSAAVAAALEGQSGWHNCLDAPYVTRLSGYPISKYMRRFLDQGLPVHFLHWRRVAEIGMAPLPWSNAVNG